MMNFSFDLQWAALTGSINPNAMMWMSTVFWAIFGWLAMIRIILCLAIVALMIVSRWRVFKKASLPGWGIFVPFYNRYLMFKVGGRSGRNFLWILIPPVFIILMLINAFKIAERFWKHWAYGLGIRFIKVVFIPILAFDDSKYLGQKPANKPATKVVAKPAMKKARTKKPAKKVKTFIKKK